MEHSSATSIQTDPHLVIEFLGKYDLHKIMKYTFISKHTEKEVLRMSTIRSRGRPLKVTINTDINTVAIPQKIKLVNDMYDAFLDDFMMFSMSNLKYKRQGVGKYKFIRKQRNIIYKNTSIGPSLMAIDEEPMALSELDEPTVHTILQNLPQLKGCSYLEGISPKVQVLLAYYIGHIHRNKLFTPLSTISVLAFKDDDKFSAFNIFFLLAAFIIVISDFSSKTLINTFFTGVCSFVDYSYDRYPFLKAFDHSRLDMHDIRVNLDGLSSIKISLEDLNRYCDDWIHFFESIPGKYTKLIADQYKKTGFRVDAPVLRLIESFRRFAEIFLVIEKFQHRLQSIAD